MMERAKLYLCNKLKKAVVALLAWSIVSVNAVWAGEVSRDVSCLSPALHCNSADFSRSVSAYYQDTVLQSKPDLVPGRLQYEKDFFRLTLKTLFPEIIQRQLIRAVRQQLLSGIDKNSVQEITVEFFHSDHPYVTKAYDYFKQLGETRLDALIGEKALIEHLLAGAEGKRIDFAGFSPPRKGAKSRDLYIKKWLTASIAALTGYDKKDLRTKTNAQLWLLYYKFKLTHQFGKVLLDEIRGGSGADFSVTIRLAQGQAVTERVRIEAGQSGLEAFVVRERETDTVLPGDQPVDTAALEEIPAAAGPELSVPADLPKALREQIHILAGQREDFSRTEAMLRLLREAKQEITAAAGALSAEEKLNTVLAWARTVHPTQGVSQKREVIRLLAPVVGEHGLLLSGDLAQTGDLVQRAIAVVETRSNVLVKKIQQRTEKELTAGYSHDQSDYVLGEIIHNRLTAAEYFARRGESGEALRVVNTIVRELSGQPDWNRALSDALSFIQESLTADRQREAAANVLRRIEKANALVDTAVGSSRDLNRLSGDLRRWGGWKQYPAMLDEAGDLLSSLKAPGARQKQVVTQALTIARTIIDSAYASEKIAPEMKTIIIGRLAPAAKILEETLAGIDERNQALLTVFSREDITSVAGAQELLKRTIRQTAAPVKSAAAIQDAVDALRAKVTDIQRAERTIVPLTAIGKVLPGLMRKLIDENSQGVLINQAV